MQLALAKRLLEVASLPLSYRDRSFFYGVASAKEARSVWSVGELPVYSGNSGYRERTYLSGSLETAFDFANLGFLTKTSRNYIKLYGTYGYVFMVSSSDLSDIFPNESDIGRFVQKVYDQQYQRHDLDSRSFGFLRWVWSILEREEQKSLIYDETLGSEGAYHTIGKKILNQMSDEEMLWLMENPKIRISNRGRVRFNKLLRISRLETQEYSSRAEVRNRGFVVSDSLEIV